MGHDNDQQEGTSAAIIATVVVFAILFVLGILFVVGAGFFWVRTATHRQQAVVAEQRAIAEVRRAEAMAQLENQQAQRAEEATAVSIELNVDQAGNIRLAGEDIDIAELRTRLTNLKETGDEVSVTITAESEVPLKHVTAILELCQELGGIECDVAAAGQEPQEDSPNEA